MAIATLVALTLLVNSNSFLPPAEITSNVATALIGQYLYTDEGSAIGVKTAEKLFHPEICIQKNTELAKTQQGRMARSTRPEVRIRPAIFPEDKEIVGQLFLAYAQSLPISLDFQNFEHELAALPGKYASEKGGALWLAYGAIEQGSSTTPTDTENAKGAQAIGCVALRPFHSTPTTTESTILLSNSTSPATRTCELKRLYLTPASRGLGVSKLLMDIAISRAREMGYKEMLLDTLRGMTPARRLYEKYGFKEIGKYYESVEDAVFYRLVL